MMQASRPVVHTTDGLGLMSLLVEKNILKVVGSLLEASRQGSVVGAKKYGDQRRFERGGLQGEHLCEQVLRPCQVVAAVASQHNVSLYSIERQLPVACMCDRKCMEAFTRSCAGSGAPCCRRSCKHKHVVGPHITFRAYRLASLAPQPPANSKLGHRYEQRRRRHAELHSVCKNKVAIESDHSPSSKLCCVRLSPKRTTVGRNIGPRAVVPVGGGCLWRRECTATNKVSCRLAIQVQATENAIQRLRVERFGMRKGGRPCALSDGAAEAQDLLRLAWASCPRSSAALPAAQLAIVYTR